MATESAELSGARSHLAEAEQQLFAADGEYHLVEGLDLLELLATGSTPESAIAANLGNTYLSRFREQIGRAVVPAAVSQQRLQQAMRLSQVLDNSPFAENCATPSLTAEIAQRFIDILFEGYSEADKQRQISIALERLNDSDAG